jgi:YHS domain-containing protein
MVLLDLLLLVLATVMARAVWRVVDGVREGLSGRAPRRQGGNVPARGIQMVRDPVCGTYVIPDRAVALADGSRRVFFCSANCRDKYRARTA